MSLPLAPPTGGEISILRSLWMKFYGVIIYLIKSIQQELLLFQILLYLVLFRCVSKFFINERFLFRCIMEISPEALNFTLGKSVTEKATSPSATAICRWVKRDILWSTFDFPRILCIISLITLFFHRQKS